MVRVRQDLCVGCGLCKEGCPQGAISVESGKAWIDRSRCNNCGICLGICPHGAIVESIPVSEVELATMVSSLRQKADNLVGRIEKLRHQESTRKGKV